MWQTQLTKANSELQTAAQGVIVYKKQCHRLASRVEELLSRIVVKEDAKEDAVTSLIETINSAYFLVKSHGDDNWQSQLFDTSPEAFQRCYMNLAHSATSLGVVFGQDKDQQENQDDLMQDRTEALLIVQKMMLEDNETRANISSDQLDSIKAMLRDLLQNFATTGTGASTFTQQTTFLQPGFEKKGEIGRGTFGSVYEGRYKGMHVAIKEVEINESTKEIAEQEVALLEHIYHPNVVRIFGDSFTSEYFYLFMEYLPRGTLHKRIFDDRDKLDVEFQKHVLKQILDALVFLHSYKPSPIVHGDLRAQNVMFDEYDHVRLIDFGLVHFKSKLDSLADKACHYRAPELFDDGAGCKRATDMYALGVILFEMANRRVPFLGKSRHLFPWLIKDGQLLIEAKSTLTDADIRAVACNCLNVNPAFRQTSLELQSLIAICDGATIAWATWFEDARPSRPASPSSLDEEHPLVVKFNAELRDYVKFKTDAARIQLLQKTAALAKSDAAAKLAMNKSLIIPTLVDFLEKQSVAVKQVTIDCLKDVIGDGQVDANANTEHTKSLIRILLSQLSLPSLALYPSRYLEMVSALATHLCKTDFIVEVAAEEQYVEILVRLLQAPLLPATEVSSRNQVSFLVKQNVFELFTLLFTASMAAKQSAVKKSIVPELVAALNQPKFEPVHPHASQCLFLLSEHVEFSKAIARADAIEPLAAQMRNGTKDAKLYSAAALMHIASDVSQLFPIAQARTIKPTVDLIVSGSPLAKEYATGLLERLSHEDKVLMVLPDAGVILPLVQLLTMTSAVATPVTRKHSAMLLMHITTIAKCKPAVVQAGGLSSLLKLIKKGDVEASGYAAAALNNLVQDNTIYARAIFEESAVSLMLTLLQLRTGSKAAIYHAQVYAAKTLRCLASSYDELRFAIGTPDSLRLLIASERDPTFDHQARIAIRGVLNNLSHNPQLARSIRALQQ